MALLKPLSGSLRGPLLNISMQIEGHHSVGSGILACLDCAAIAGFDNPSGGSASVSTKDMQRIAQSVADKMRHSASKNGLGNYNNAYRAWF